MSYRNITVDGKLYQYALGRTHLKIKHEGKHFKLLKTSEIGNELYNTGRYVVTPAVVIHAIKGDPLPRVFHCQKHGHTTTQLAYDPFGAEIENKFYQVMHCPRCLDESAWNI